MKKQNYPIWIIVKVKNIFTLSPFFLFTFLLLFLFTFSSLPTAAQGLPLIRNFTSAEYDGHNRNYDIEIGEDGTVFVANFEGFLYYDRAQWRIIHTTNNRRVTAIYRDSRNTVWVGGYNFMARLQKRTNGELFLQQFGEEGQFSGEVMEIFEEEESLQFVAGDNNIYEVKGRDNMSSPTISLKRRPMPSSNQAWNPTSYRWRL